MTSTETAVLDRPVVEPAAGGPRRFELRRLAPTVLAGALALLVAAAFHTVTDVIGGILLAGLLVALVRAAELKRERAA